MRGALRLGRYAVRAGGSVQRQSGPPPRFGIVGTTVCLLFFAALTGLWWREFLIGLGVTVLFAFPLAVALGKAKLARRQQQQDPLDDLMRRWDEEGRR